MVWLEAAERLTVKTALIVPVSPSVTETLLMLSEGAFGGGQVPSLSSTETLPEPELATATSGRPSPLKSPAAAAEGVVPTVAVMGNDRVPSPLLRSALTIPLLESAVTTSILPSL